MERRLKLAGYQVATYPSAQQLLDRLPDENEPGCILLDVQIPGLSGPELQGRLSEIGSDLADRVPDRSRRHADDRAGHQGRRRRLSDQAGRTAQLLGAIERALARHAGRAASGTGWKRCGRWWRL